MLSKIRRLLRKPPVQIGQTIFLRLARKPALWWQRSHPPGIEMAEFLERTKAPTEPGQAVSFFTVHAGAFFPFEEALVAIDSTDDSETTKAATVAAADRACAHIFDFLGSGPTELGSKIDWSRDFKSGQVWEKRPSPEVPIMVLSDESDIKVPWELSRFQHLVPLGQAYRFSNDERYASEFVDQIDDWLSENPIGFGVNWACTMDVAIRAVNWVWAWKLFQDSPTIDDSFWLRFIHALYMHGRFIRANLEWVPVRHNHYLSDITGLTYLGIVFRQTDEGSKWLDLAVRELEREIRHQVYEDGVDHEGSIPYHRLVLELFLSSTLLLRINGVALSDTFMERLEKMMEFTKAYTKPDGTVPLFGDADDGRLHILSEETRLNINDHRYLLAVGAVLFERPDFKAAAGRFWTEAWWLLGPAGRDSFADLGPESGVRESIAFPEGGFFFLRDRDHYCAVDCGPVGLRGGGGHGHNDALSFEIYFGGRTFITDSGTYVYSADAQARNSFRATRAHNVIGIDGQEMAELGEGYDLWTIADQAKASSDGWESGEDYDHFSGRHLGYSRLPGGPIHHREVYFFKRLGVWLLKDVVKGEGGHSLETFFHLPFRDVRIDQSQLAAYTELSEKNLAILPLETDGLSIEREESWFSPSYGVRLEATTVIYSNRTQLPWEQTTLLMPFDGEPPRAEQVRRVAGEVAEYLS